MPDLEMDCVLGLGSNLGDRLAFFGHALRELRFYTKVTAISALYESCALGPVQPDYLNAAFRLRTPLSAPGLLALQLEIERAAGRVRGERWGPRTLDLDLLYISGQTVSLPNLVVPHPELTRRAFALLPLLDVMPEALDPVSGRSYAQLSLDLDRTGVRVLATPSAGWLE